ncbi:MAG: BNR-4 repeat-containing protein [Saprospiraceae bacterium]|nr:BNR-4 repeat-containing protein [Lewinella sp.]
MLTKRKTNLLFALITLLFLACSTPKEQTGYLTEDGAWCWFSDPRAIFDDGQIITGWVKTDGSIEAAAFDPESGSVNTAMLYPELQSDDHDNPAFVKTGDGKLLVTYTTHSGPDGFFMNKTSDGTSIASFGPSVEVALLDSTELEKFPKVHVTYANPYKLETENNRLYCFGRWTGYKPNMMWSDDDGQTWSKSRVFITNEPFDPNNRPYAKYYSDGQSRIHIIFTDGHPRVEPTNSVYYAYYEEGAFYRADGTQIADMSSLPFEPKDATVIYQSNETDGRAWIADVAADEQGRPVVLYTRSPSETDHRYWYAKYDGQQWINNEMCKAGKWFPQTQEGQEEREPHYFGNMSVHPEKTNVVYLSRQVDGVFEIERWETDDDGKSWQSEPITQHSQLDNVRPYVPRYGDAGKEIVLWMENRKYIHYTDFKTAIRYYIR